jgi:predicted ATPase
MTTKQVFVAREHELRQLDHYHERAIAGDNQVCFVIGEAGSGKTALVREFALRALEKHEDLIIAVGQCDAQTGMGDAYLPFRELMGQLTGDVDTNVALGDLTQENAGRLRKFLGFSGQALVDLGPDLIGIFVPGVGLATRAAAFLAEKVGWLEKLENLTKRSIARQEPDRMGVDQNQIFEQYTNVLNKLAERQPLLLVLDDLQWADAASIDLLFRLGRRIRGSRILLIGTYRPVEVASGRDGRRHPLGKVCSEFKRYFGEIRVDLNQAQESDGQPFVDAFIDTEPNRLSQVFRQALYHHTGGHPLFTIELLRAMQERGDLIMDQGGHWIEGPVLDWDDLPARVEGVIEERIGRLEDELQEMLTVASVEGESFTAEVVAQLQTMNARRLIHRLGRELEVQHRLVCAQGTRRLGTDGQRISRYRFQNNLFQAYLYNNIYEAERTYLHESVGRTLEALFGDQVEEVFVQLAYHFTAAGVMQKARRYLRWAGEQAAARHANLEAVNFLSRALDLTPVEDGTSPERFALLMAREKIYNLMGERDAQEVDLTSLARLVETLDDNEPDSMKWQAEVALRQAVWAEVTGDYPGALQSSETAIHLAQDIQDVALEALSYQSLGFILWRKGEYEAAKSPLQQALILAQKIEFHEVEARCLMSLAVVFWRLGDNQEAKVHNEASLNIYREIGNRVGESRVINNLGNLSWSLGKFIQAREYYMQSLIIDQETGDKRGELGSLGNLGIIAQNLSEYEQGKGYFEQVLHTSREIEDRESEARALGNLACMYMDLGLYPKAKITFEAALIIFQEIDNRQAECWIHAGLGLLHHQMGSQADSVSHSQICSDYAQELGIRSYQAIGLHLLGMNQERSGELEAAAVSYHQAHNIFLELGEHSQAMECVAGLATIALVQDDLPQAQARIEEILGYIDTKEVDDSKEPLQIFLVCYRVLTAGEKPRAETILSNAYHLLQERAAKIKDDALRCSFLENVRTNREILHTYERKNW